MRKVYEINGKTYLYNEGEQPAGAVEVSIKVPTPAAKIETPAEKPRPVKNKAARPAKAGAQK